MCCISIIFWMDVPSSKVVLNYWLSCPGGDISQTFFRYQLQWGGQEPCGLVVNTLPAFCLPCGASRLAGLPGASPCGYQGGGPRGDAGHHSAPHAGARGCWHWQCDFAMGCLVWWEASARGPGQASPCCKLGVTVIPFSWRCPIAKTTTGPNPQPLPRQNAIDFNERLQGDFG